MLSLFLLACASGPSDSPAPTDPGDLYVGGGYGCLLKDGVATCQFLDEREYDDGQTRAPEQGWASLALGFATACGLRPDGTARCWGWNVSGQTDVPNGAWSRLEVASEHGCGLRPDNSVVCWGSNYGGETVPPSGAFIDIALYSAKSFALTSDGEIVDWGYDFEGATQPPEGTGFADVQAFGTSACALTREGSLACWGAPSGIASPPAGTGFTSLTKGYHHACALTAAREAVCWGDDEYGQVSATPGGTWRSIDAGLALTCGERDTGAIECWGCYGEGDAYCTWGTPVEPYGAAE